MASNITIQMKTDSQSARVIVPLSAIDTKANAAATAEFTSHVIKSIRASEQEIGSETNNLMALVIMHQYKPHDEKWFLIAASIHDTVKTLKYRIQDQEGFAANRQRLLFAGNEMRDEETLGELRSITDTLGERRLENGSKVILVYTMGSAGPVVDTISHSIEQSNA